MSKSIVLLNQTKLAISFIAAVIVTLHGSGVSAQLSEAAIKLPNAAHLKLEPALPVRFLAHTQDRVEHTIPWGEMERDVFLQTLKNVYDRVPAIVQRAVGEGVIDVYRVPTISLKGASVTGTFALSRRISELRTQPELFIADNFFALPSCNVAGTDYRLWVLAHEFGHLADINHELDDSVAWLKIATPLIERTRQMLKRKGFDEHSPETLEKYQICMDCGVPTPIGLTHPRELLAEYVSARCTGLVYKEPPAVRAFLNRRLFISGAR